jgi:SAM-dependent methyltransferase
VSQASAEEATPGASDAARRAGRCPICGSVATPAGHKVGRWRARPYHLARCAACAFAFITDPDTDFADIYNADYYRGRGADPLVHYETDITAPQDSSRAYELAGLVDYARAAVSLRPQERWLDFGSGLGGFVEHLRRVDIQAYGYDEGYAAGEALGRGVPMLSGDALAQAEGTFGVVSAIEVLEHVLDPLDTMHRIARLLRPGGLFLYTTGNAAPFRKRLTQWSYVVPEIHVSFYEPRTMRTIFERTGLVPLQPVRRSALHKVIRYKIMKNLNLARGGVLDRFLPWPLLTNIADRRFQISSMVLAVKAATDPKR